MTIAAKYEHGVFKPLEDVKVKEGTVVEVHLPSDPKPAGRLRSIKELPFYGMWADHADVKDGLSYVNKLRDEPRG